MSNYHARKSKRLQARLDQQVEACGRMSDKLDAALGMEKLAKQQRDLAQQTLAAERGELIEKGPINCVIHRSHMGISPFPYANGGPQIARRDIVEIELKLAAHKIGEELLRTGAIMVYPNPDNPFSQISLFINVIRPDVALKDRIRVDFSLAPRL